MDERAPTLRLDARRAGAIARAAELLRGGGTVALPTETVYGLGARGLDADAVAAIYRAKGRPADNPLILHVHELQAALPLWRLDEARVAERIERLAAALWPGPLTLIAPRSELVPDCVTAGLPRVAVRVPAHPVALALLRALGEPLAAPSANASGRPSPTTAEHVLYSLEGRIDAVLDGGPCAHGLESTVVDLSGEVPLILRSGALSPAALRRVLPDLTSRPPGRQAHSSDASPGLRHQHYAPLVPEIVLGGRELLRAHWSGSDALLLRRSTAEALSEALGPRPRGALLLALADTPEDFGRELYAALYRAELASPSRLVLEEPPESEEWSAARDRLLRASARPE